MMSPPDTVTMQQASHIEKQKRHSLNAMIMAGLAALQEKNQAAEPAATARDVTDYIRDAYGVAYPIQTIIVVLNRLVKKGLVSRITNQSDDIRHRYCFYLNQSPQELREERIFRRFKAFTDEFFQGNLELALFEIQKVVAKAYQKG